MKKITVTILLLCAAFGLAPYQAAAQTMRAANVPAAIAPLAAVAASLPGLAAPTVSLAPPFSLVPAIRIAPLSVKAAPPVQAIQALQGGAKSVAAAIQKNADAPRAALDGLFEGSTPSIGEAAVSAPGETAVPSGLNKPALERAMKRTLAAGSLAMAGSLLPVLTAKSAWAANTAALPLSFPAWPWFAVGAIIGLLSAGVYQREDGRWKFDRRTAVAGAVAVSALVGLIGALVTAELTPIAILASPILATVFFRLPDMISEIKKF